MTVTISAFFASLFIGENNIETYLYYAGIDLFLILLIGCFYMT